MENGNQKSPTLLISNMTTLVQQGKLSQQQILQLKRYADQHKNNPAVPTSTGTPVASTSSAAQSSHPAFKGAADSVPNLANTPSETAYPISANLNHITNPGAVQWTQTRPTLTGGIPSGRMSGALVFTFVAGICETHALPRSGTPAQIARPADDSTMLSLDDNRSRRKNTPGDQSMRRTIQDLVASVDPNVKIEPDVEDLLLSIADEFIDSVTNFSCRLAKHRGGDTLEVRDLQLHLERNHNIRIPGFASDETRISLSQSSVAPVAPAPQAKKTAQGTHMTLRSQRLNQVQQAKREAKLM
ncbi:transcription initiation factor TFIID subunit A-domain-containing protein [Armillaria novae-zelandiae]|uniref:TBP-associated factor 12 n=1 Tax=Armillaria novae-zelandiae TaxID=153914 RepID=A0AA39PVH1_9AGAR|nr:transcription initiation factor TFIID subunit A-domain-containing protein [Armillaria novae-zelandiae]